ncbi:MAG: ERF family protein [Halomonas sp.]|nr:ERF family protein [Halomonas sp.]
MSGHKVYAAIAAVMHDMAMTGVAKGQRNQQQNYQFRGIDDIYNALAPKLAHHGLVIAPRMVSRQVVERQTAKGGVLFYVTVEAEFDFISAEDGSIHTVRTFGEAMDSGDKATNKAMTSAYKYAAFQTFCIPTEAQDSELHTYEVASQESARQQALMEAVHRLEPSIQAIKQGIASGDLGSASEAWAELTNEEKQSIWVAPTKGGPFTTDERKVMQSKEFREAHFGPANQPEEATA